MTLHRPSNVDAPDVLRRILRPLLELSETLPVVFPCHPRTRVAIERNGLGASAVGFRLIEPLGYLDFLKLMMEARAVVTDSGGIQEETTILGVPCVTVRDNTERPITLTHGTNRLAGTTEAGIRQALARALDSDAVAPEPPPLWDGRAAERIVEVLVAWGARR